MDYIYELQVEIEQLEGELVDAQVDQELLIDYITYMELKYMGKLVNGRLPFFDDEMEIPEYVGGE